MIKDMEVYEKLMDFIFEKIFQLKKIILDELKKIRLEKFKEILRKVQKRKLYKFVGIMNLKRSIKIDFELKVIIYKKERNWGLKLLDCKCCNEKYFMNYIYVYFIMN